ncbi:MAG: PQQ-binding-like beta-propeller repeat protein [Thermoguttaceae bacterium]
MKRILFSSVMCLSLLSSTIFAAEPWNQWRGADHNGHSPDKSIATSWPEGGPKLLWQIDTLGAGYSNVSFWGDQIFTMGDIDGKSQVVALSRKDGKMLWKTVVGGAGGGNGFAGPRCTPATNGKLVFALNQFGDFIAVEAANGKEVWRKNMERDFGGKMMSGWGYSESPIFISDTELVCIPGGQNGSVMCLDAATGNVKWRCTELKDDAAYTSVVPMTFGGELQLVVLTGRSIAAVSPVDGKLLWATDFPGKVAVCSDPVAVGNDIFASCAYGVGAVGYRLNANDNAINRVYANAQFENHHGGIVAVGDCFYFTTNRNLVCVRAATGEVVWQDRCVGKGSVTYVAGHLVVRAEGGDGAVALVVATPDGYQEKARFNQPDRSDKNSWTHPTVLDGKLYLRDQNRLFVYDVK